MKLCCVKANLLKVHGIWRDYFKWSPKHRGMKSVSNVSEYIIYISGKGICSTPHSPKEKPWQRTGTKSALAEKSRPRSASRLCALCVLSCMHPASETKTQSLSSLHLPPPHPHFGLYKKVSGSGGWRKQDPRVPHKSSLDTLGTASFSLGIIICVSASL